MALRRRSALVSAVGLAFSALAAGCQPPPPSPETGGASTGTAGSCASSADGGACARSQPVLACDLRNARDLGGVPLAPAGSVACGALFRGPPLARLSPAGCAETARLGLRTVIDLRTEGERLGAPDDPCTGARVVAAPLPVPYEVSPENYLADFDTDASIVAAFHALGDDAAYPIYFHCTYGRDRTGVFAAAVLLVLGASRDDIMAEYQLSAATVGAYPPSLAAVLDEIEKRGGIDAALTAKGVPASDLAALRAHVAAP